MDIAGAQFDGFFEQIVHGPDYRCAAGKIAQAFYVVFARQRRRGLSALGIVGTGTPAQSDRNVF